ncbi:MAG: hypothetical protein WB815_10920 [Nitrososphaeraceae archaeon]
MGLRSSTTTTAKAANPLLDKKLEDIRAKISNKYSINLLLATGVNVPTSP